jgi:hypothetical protein
VAAPDITAYADTGFGGTGGTLTTASFSWLNGDIFVVIAGVEAAGDTLGNPTTGGANLSFGASLENPNTASSCQGKGWLATASGTGSGTISGTNTSTVHHWGFSVWQLRKHTGDTGSIAQGTHNSSDAGGNALNESLSVSKTAGPDSFFAWGLFDFAPSSVGTVVPTPTHSRVAAQQSTFYTTILADVDPQSTAGATLYGESSAGSATGPFTIVVIEVTGTTTPATQAALTLTRPLLTLGSRTLEGNFTLEGSSFLPNAATIAGQGSLPEANSPVVTQATRRSSFY